MPRSVTNECSTNKHNNFGNGSGCSKQHQQATQQLQQHHSQQSLVQQQQQQQLQQQHPQQQNYPPHNSNKNNNNNNNHIANDVSMTNFSISPYTLNQKDATNGHKNAVVANISSNNNNNNNTHISGCKNKNSNNNQNNQNNTRTATVPSMLLVSPSIPSLHTICEIPLLPVQFF